MGSWTQSAFRELVADVFQIAAVPRFSLELVGIHDAARHDGGRSE